MNPSDLLQTSPGAFLRYSGLAQAKQLQMEKCPGYSRKGTRSFTRELWGVHGHDVRRRRQREHIHSHSNRSLSCARERSNGTRRHSPKRAQLALPMHTLKSSQTANLSLFPLSIMPLACSNLHSHDSWPLLQAYDSWNSGDHRLATFQINHCPKA